MTTEDRELVFQRTVQSSPAEVYRAFTHPTALRDWLCKEASVDSRPGGALFLKWQNGYTVLGEFLEIEKDRHLRFTWRGRDEPFATLVDVQLIPEGENTQVRLEHLEVPLSASWDQQAEEFRDGWKNGLENLQSFLETGLDLRVIRRPMLGILFEEFSPEVAAKLGVPVSAGVYLAGTVEGMGAQAAGLQAQDVLVEMDGQPLPNPDALGPILQKHQGGDTVEVAYYRGAELRKTQMTLSKRPIPEHPATAAELAEWVRNSYTEMDRELAASLEGITEESADKRPSPEEWTAKENLAHFIAAERDLHTWMADMLNDHPIPDSLEYSSNAHVRMTAIVSVHPTIPDLLEELKRCQAETVEMLVYLPDELLRRKHIFFRIAEWVKETPDHFKEHTEQLKRALG